MQRIQSPLEIYLALLEWTESGRPFACATILQSAGSTPQKNGVKALIESRPRAEAVAKHIVL